MFMQNKRMIDPGNKLEMYCNETDSNPTKITFYDTQVKNTFVFYHKS